MEIGNIKPRRLLARVARMPGEERQFVAVFVDVTRGAPAGVDAPRLRGQRLARAAHARDLDPLRGRDVDRRRRPPIRRHRRRSSASSTETRSDCSSWSKTCSTCRASSRVASGFSFEPIDLKPIFSQVLGLFRERAWKKERRPGRARARRPAQGAGRPTRARACAHQLDRQCGQVLRPGTHVWLNVGAQPGRRHG